MTFCSNRPGLTSMKSASAFQRSVYLPTGSGFRKTKKPQLASGFVKIGGMFSEHTPSTSKMLSSGDLAVKMVDLTKNFLRSPADLPFRLRSSVLIRLGRSDLLFELGELLVLRRGLVPRVGRDAGDLGRGEPELGEEGDEEGRALRDRAVALDPAAAPGEVAAEEPDATPLAGRAVRGRVQQRMGASLGLYRPLRPCSGPLAVALAEGLRISRRDAERSSDLGRRDLSGGGLAGRDLSGIGRSRPWTDP